MRRHTIALISLSVMLTCSTSYAHAGFWGKVWGGAKSVASAPFKAGGWLIGQGVKSAVDPAIDGTFRRLRETTDYAAEKVDAVVGKHISKLDEMAKSRIDQIDKVMEKRLDQVDSMLDDKIQKISDLANHVLDRQAEILDTSLSRVEVMMRDNLSDLDRLSADTLNRLEEVQSNAFDRVDAALQDQVPLAAGLVARQFVLATTILVFIVVLVGYGGIQLFKGVPSLASSGGLSFRTVLDKLKENLRSTGKAVVHVGVPMAMVAFLIHGIYWSYYTTANSARVSRLQSAAVVFEAAGDFRSALAFRKRAFALDGSTDHKYWVNRNELLASFVQAHGRTNPTEIARRLGHLLSQNSKNVALDGEIQAMRVYLVSRYNSQTGFANLIGSSTNNLTQDIIAYKAAHFKKAAIDRPSLGYLVLMSDIAITLDDPALMFLPRLKAANALAAELAAAYPTYAAGLIVRAQLASFLVDQASMGPSVQTPDSVLLASIETDLKAATAIDPILVRYVELLSRDLPDHALSEVHGYANQEVANRTEEAKNKVQAKLLEFTSELNDAAKQVFGWQPLAEMEVERALTRSLRRSLGEAAMNSKIDAARNVVSGLNANVLPNVKITLCLNVADAADKISRPDIASLWLDKAKELMDLNPDAKDETLWKRFDTLLKQVYNQKLTSLLAAL